MGGIIRSNFCEEDVICENHSGIPRARAPVRGTGVAIVQNRPAGNRFMVHKRQSVKSPSRERDFGRADVRMQY